MNKKIIVFFVVIITVLLSSCGKDEELEVNLIKYFDSELLNIENEEINTKKEANKMYEEILETLKTLDTTFYEESKDYLTDLENMKSDGMVTKEEYFTLNQLEYYKYKGAFLVQVELNSLWFYLSSDLVTNFTEEETFIRNGYEITIFVNDDSLYFQTLLGDDNIYNNTTFTYRLLENGHYVFEMFSEERDNNSRSIKYLNSSSENGYIFIDVNSNLETVNYTYQEADFIDKTFHAETLRNDTSKLIAFRDVDFNTGIEYGFESFIYAENIRTNRFVSFLNDNYEYVFSHAIESENDIVETETNYFTLIALEGWDYYNDHDILYSNDIELSPIDLSYQLAYYIVLEETLTEELLNNPLSELSLSGVVYDDIERISQLIFNEEELFGFSNNNPIIDGVEYTDFDLLFEKLLSELPIN